MWVKLIDNIFLPRLWRGGKILSTNFRSPPADAGERPCEQIYFFQMQQL
ncbi:MAG: hypothetical protein LBR79_02335 [Oscillospiraceae bacterium]|nr:hypothetical protein [Oscillospiraceae bacterium]